MRAWLFGRKPVRLVRGYRPALALWLALTGVAGCASSGGDAPEISATELVAAQAARTVVLVDVRSPAEFAGGHVPGAWNVPVDQVAARADEIRARAAGGEVVLYCQSGRRAASAAAALRAAGLTRLRHLAGDYRAWAAAGRPVESSSSGP